MSGRASVEDEEKTDRPPWTRMRGLPVRVMVTSEMARFCTALLKARGADRAAIGRGAILAAAWIAESAASLSIGGAMAR